MVSQLQKTGQKSHHENLILPATFFFYKDTKLMFFKAGNSLSWSSLEWTDSHLQTPLWAESLDEKTQTTGLR